MAKFVKVGEDSYIMETVDGKWKITKTIYTDVKGNRTSIDVTAESRPMLEEVKRLDENRLQREAYSRKMRQGGKGCTFRSQCDQCGDCCRSYMNVKKFNSRSSVLETLVHREHRAGVRHAIENAISQLPKKQQHLIRQMYHNGFKASELVKIESMGKSAISRMHKRAIENLKTLLAENVNFLS
jgi:hypothetical protein